MDAGEGGTAGSREEHRISINPDDHNAGGSGVSVAGPGITEEVIRKANEEWIREMESKIEKIETFGCTYSGSTFETPYVEGDYLKYESLTKICKLTVLNMISQPRSETVERLSQPSVVTIGPFHREDPTSISDKEKWVIVGLMNSLYGLDLASYLVKIGKQVRKAVSYYDLCALERSGLSNYKRFAEMLLLDSCFILFMLTIKLHKILAHCIVLMPKAPNPARPSLLVFQDGPLKFLDIIFNKEEIVPDLLILDNQIPFFVIEELFKELKWDKPLEYALEFFETIHPKSGQHCKDQNSPPPEFIHLLHLFHWSRVPQNKYILPKQLDSIGWARHTPNVMELRESTTVFEKKTSGSSLDIAFRRRRFKSFIGVLDIPEVHIRDYSSLIFHNLIAFEIQSSRGGRCTMAFSALMRNLLQSEEDVKLLRRRGILASTSMTDSELVDLFKRLSRLIENHQMPSDLYAICHQVQSYHNHPVRRFCGSVILQYFPNPLVTLSVFGATMLFILTLLQTIYTMISAHHS